MIVSPLGRGRQRQTRRTQFVALGLFLVRRTDERERAPAEATDTALGERHYSMT